MSTIIGLHGKARAGKDTVADLLMEKISDVHTDAVIYRTSFAEPIRLAAKAVFGPHYEEKEIPAPCLGISPRQFMQEMGTEFARNNFYPSIWIQALKLRVQHYEKEMTLDYIIIPDVRFINEARWVLDQGGTLIEINRDTEAVRDHSSEAGIPREWANLIVDNTKSLEELELEVNSVVKYITKE